MRLQVKLKWFETRSKNTWSKNTVTGSDRHSRCAADEERCSVVFDADGGTVSCSNQVMKIKVTLYSLAIYMDAPGRKHNRDHAPCSTVLLTWMSNDWWSAASSRSKEDRTCFCQSRIDAWCWRRTPDELNSPVPSGVWRYCTLWCFHQTALCIVDSLADYAAR